MNPFGPPNYNQQNINNSFPMNPFGLPNYNQQNINNPFLFPNLSNYIPNSGGSSVSEAPPAAFMGKNNLFNAGASHNNANQINVINVVPQSNNFSDEGAPPNVDDMMDEFRKRFVLEAGGTGDALTKKSTAYAIAASDILFSGKTFGFNRSKFFTHFSRRAIEFPKGEGFQESGAPDLHKATGSSLGTFRHTDDFKEYSSVNRVNAFTELLTDCSKAAFELAKSPNDTSKLSKFESYLWELSDYIDPSDVEKGEGALAQMFRAGQTFLAKKDKTYLDRFLNKYNETHELVDGVLRKAAKVVDTTQIEVLQEADVAESVDDFIERWQEKIQKDKMADKKKHDNFVNNLNTGCWKVSPNFELINTVHLTLDELQRHIASSLPGSLMAQHLVDLYADSLINNPPKSKDEAMKRFEHPQGKEMAYIDWMKELKEFKRTYFEKFNKAYNNCYNLRDYSQKLYAKEREIAHQLAKLEKNDESAAKKSVAIAPVPQKNQPSSHGKKIIPASGLKPLNLDSVACRVLVEDDQNNRTLYLQNGTKIHYGADGSYERRNPDGNGFRVEMSGKNCWKFPIEGGTVQRNKAEQRPLLSYKNDEFFTTYFKKSPNGRWFMSRFEPMKPTVTKFDLRQGMPTPKYVTYRCFKHFPSAELKQLAWKVTYANGESAEFYNGGLYRKLDQNGRLVFASGKENARKCYRTNQFGQIVETWPIKLDNDGRTVLHDNAMTTTHYYNGVDCIYSEFDPNTRPSATEADLSPALRQRMQKEQMGSNIVFEAFSQNDQNNIKYHMGV